MTKGNSGDKERAKARLRVIKFELDEFRSAMEDFQRENGLGVDNCKCRVELQAALKQVDGS